MFWKAYEVEYLTDDPEIMDNIHTIDFWENRRNIHIQNDHRHHTKFYAELPTCC